VVCSSREILVADAQLHVAHSYYSFVLDLASAHLGIDLIADQRLYHTLQLDVQVKYQL